MFFESFEMDYVNFDLNSMSAAEVAELLAYHDQLYWQQNAPLISDARYDEITEKLRQLSPDHPLLSRINTPQVVSGGKVRHMTPMLSLDKAYSLEELLQWAEKYARSENEELLVEPKYDGISANFDGRILATRGDGSTGEDISDKLPLIELEAPGYRGKVAFCARGEIVIRDDDFREIYSHIRKKDGGVYKNSRNAVAGIMGLKDITPMQIQGAKLTLVDYSLISFKVKLKNLPSSWEQLKEKLAGLPYPMDGIVLKFADKTFRESLGNTAHHPRGEIAYKFTNRSAATTLLDVEWSCGKNCLTPVAILSPVELSGITIKRASLHNVQNLIDMQLMIGDTVTVERAGDVIPFISSSVPGELRRSPFIENCPVCSAGLIRKGPELCCNNPDCPGSRLQLLAAAVKNLGIERLGEPTLAKLMQKCHVRHLKDLFDLTAADILTLDGFAGKSADNLISEIQKCREVDDYQVLAALNIPNVGLNIAKLILREISFAELRDASEEKLSQISGIGPERAAAIRMNMVEKAEELDELCSALKIRSSCGSETGSGNFFTVCFTGKMPEKRSFYESLAKARGMTPVDSVNSKLDLLVAMDVNDNSSKLKNARKLGVKTVSLDEFLAGKEDVSEEENFETDLFSPTKTTASPAEPEKKADDFDDLPLFS